VAAELVWTLERGEMSRYLLHGIICIALLYVVRGCGEMRC
jgi:hypothetical protein